MKEEIWKPIKKLDDKYDISNYGRIRNHEKQNILKERTNNRGYHLVYVYLYNTQITVMLHRCLAEEFIRDSGINPDGTIMKGKHQVNHKDGNKNNNILENLEWCDQSYNMREAYRLGLRKYVPHEISDEYREKMRKISSTPSPGKEIQMINNETNEVIETFESSRDAVKKHPELNLKSSSICDAANHRRGLQTYKGYKWKFTGKITNGKKCRESKKKNK